jgi:5-formyltetrahydrofolate cyclo-ligase
VKKERRHYYRQLQNSFTTQQYQAWNIGLRGPLAEIAKKLAKNSVIAVYQAKPKEADLSSLFTLPFKFCFPKVLSKNGLMEFRLVENPTAAQFEPGAFGILEPRPKHPKVEKSEVQVCFVPLLAFDGHGRRLGQGMGFYDRFLEGFSGFKIGVGFEWQFSPQPLPVEAYDQPLDGVITEHGIRTFTLAAKKLPFSP